MLGILSAIKDVKTKGGPFSPKKLTLDIEGGKAVTFPHMLNPNDYKIGRKVTWKCSPGEAGKNGGSQFYSFSSGTDTLSFSCVMDCSEEYGVDLLTEIQALYDLTYPFTPDADVVAGGMRGQMVKVFWGGFKFTGVVDSLDVTVTLFDPEGRAKRATVTLAMQGNAFISEDKDKFFYHKGKTPRPAAEAKYKDGILEAGDTSDPKVGKLDSALAKLGI